MTRGFYRCLAVAILLAPVAARAQDGVADLPERLAPGADGAFLITSTSPLAFAAASAAQPRGPAPTPEHTGFRPLLKDLWHDVQHLPSSTNAIIATIGGGAALAVHPADASVSSSLVDASWASNVFAPGAFIGDTPFLLGSSIAVYGIGRIRDEKRVSHLGMDMLQAIIVNEMMTVPLKYAVGRERPDHSDNLSFPSGHASNTFAVATTIERHLGWKGAVPAYIFASYVAASRIHEDVHYLSDVVFGAAVGTIAGRTVSRHGRELPITVTAVPGGAAILYVRRDAN
jgi:hypothetical protein